MVDVGGIQVVSKLMIDLIRGYGRGKVGLFESHVDPLHQRILAIHSDYCDGFEDVRDHLKAGMPVPHVVDFLKERSRELHAERDLTAKLARELAAGERRLVRDTTWANVRTYCQLIERYFHSAAGVAGQSWYSSCVGHMEMLIVLNTLHPSTLPRAVRHQDDILAVVEDTLTHGLPKRLAAVNTYYAMLRSELL